MIYSKQLKIGLLVVVGIISGCSTVQPLPPSYQTEFKLTIHWDDNPTKTGNAAGVGGVLGGWSSVGEGVCVINQPKPTSQDDIFALATIGHEILHCTDKDYHK